jgi:aspartyl/asparaginyl beta-hydroxylase (cupin superfamily)
MANFTRIAGGLDVAPALAELARQPEYWLQLNTDDSRSIPLLGVADCRLLESELPECWRLIDTVRAILAAAHGDRGRLIHARVGLMPPGCGLPPHFDGVDGVVDRRYQLALASAPGAELIVGGEMKCPRPGEAWWIDASRTHSVANNSEADRITILFDTRS